MARTLHVYPKAQLVGSTWTLVVKVHESLPRTLEADGSITNPSTNSRFVHEVPAGITIAEPLVELKMSFDLVVGDTDTDQDVDDALFLDDIKPGGGTETVWGNWQERAEGIISSLTDPTLAEYWAEWTQQDTAAVRTDARRSLITQRGWSVPFIHWHEGDGTAGDEAG